MPLRKSPDFIRSLSGIHPLSCPDTVPLAKSNNLLQIKAPLTRCRNQGSRMAETDLHAKLDRLLAGQADHARAIADLATGIGAVVQGVSGLVPLLGMQTEMLRLILEAATREPPGDMDLGQLLANLLATMERVEATVIALPEALRQTFTPAAGGGADPYPHEPGQGG